MDENRASQFSLWLTMSNNQPRGCPQLFYLFIDFPSMYVTRPKEKAYIIFVILRVSKRVCEIIIFLRGPSQKRKTKGCVTMWPCHFTFKSILRQKKIFHHARIYNLQKNPPKETKIPSRYHNSITNLNFQHKAKMSWFKNPHIKIDLVCLGAKIP
jgi:hypothetical protein